MPVWNPAETSLALSNLWAFRMAKAATVGTISPGIHLGSMILSARTLHAQVTQASGVVGHGGMQCTPQGYLFQKRTRVRMWAVMTGSEKRLTNLKTIGLSHSS